MLLHLSFFNSFIFNSSDVANVRRQYPPTPAAIIIQMGEKPNSQMSSAETTGIHMLYRFIRADLAMLNVGAAINATTAGRIPLNIRSTMVLSLKLWKEQRYGEDDEKRRKYGSQCSDYAPSYSP